MNHGIVDQEQSNQIPRNALEIRKEDLQRASCFQVLESQMEDLSGINDINELNGILARQ